jgi:hypothetical protein
MIFLWIFTALTHTLYRWHVWCYILRIYNTYLHNKCFLSRLYNDTGCFVQWQSTLLCLVIHRFARVCHFSKQLTTHRPTSHLLRKYSVLRVRFFSEHTRHRLCFPLECQCCECFTSKRLSWDENELGLPLETPPAVNVKEQSNPEQETLGNFCGSSCHHLTYA